MRTHNILSRHWALSSKRRDPRMSFGHTEIDSRTTVAYHQQIDVSNRIARLFCCSHSANRLWHMRPNAESSGVICLTSRSVEHLLCCESNRIIRKIIPSNQQSRNIRDSMKRNPDAKKTPYSRLPVSEILYLVTIPSKRLHR
jgi:hypothetical protein